MKRLFKLWGLKREMNRLAGKLQWQRKCSIELLLYCAEGQRNYHVQMRERQKLATETALNEVTSKYLRLKLRIDEKC